MSMSMSTSVLVTLFTSMSPFPCLCQCQSVQFLFMSCLHSFLSVLWSRNYLFPHPLRLRLSKSFGSGSGAGSGNSFGTTCYHRFYIKKYIFHVFLWKKIDLIHMLDPIQYEFWILFTTLADPEPERKLWYSGSSQKFRLLAAPAPAPQHWILCCISMPISIFMSMFMITFTCMCIMSMFM